MNLEDIDFEAEWEKFKSKAGSGSFIIVTVSNLNCLYVFDDDAIGINMNRQFFKILMESGFILSVGVLTYKVNPKQLCSMSNPSIQHVKEGLSNERR